MKTSTTDLVRRAEITDENAVVARHNNLVEAHYYASPQEQRLFNWAAHQVQEAKNNSQVVRVGIAELANFVGIEKNANLYKEMLDVTDRMTSRKIRIQNLDNGEFVQANLMNARYRPGEGYVEVELSTFILPYILQLKKNFTTISMRYLMRLGSGYAMRIYELLKSRRYRGHKVRFDIEDLQSILGTKDKYQRFNNFRSRVLDVACEEINARTDIKVSFEIEPHKSDRRKAGTVVFNVSDRAGGSVTALPVAGHELVTRLTHAGLPEIEAMKIVEQFGGTDRERITWHLDEVGARVAAHTVKSPAAWLRAGIRADYRPQRSPLERELEDKAKRMADEKAGRERAVTADKARREADDDAAAKKHERVRRHIAQVVAALSDTARRDVIAAVEQRLAAGVLRETWNRKPDLGSVVYQKLITDAILDITGLDARRE